MRTVDFFILYSGIIFLAIPILIFAFIGNVYQLYSFCTTSPNEATTTVNSIGCIYLKILMLLYPLFFIIGILLLIYVSLRIRKGRRK